MDPDVFQSVQIPVKTEHVLLLMNAVASMVMEAQPAT